jgi:hypothetical protein
VATAGQKADATIVVNAVRDRYSNPAKDAIRTWVIRELQAAEPTLVLDLWGGGRSADEMTAAGLPVLSVDDGRGFADFGITKMRARRALEIKAEQGGYRAGWGAVAKYAPECDAAWLDFMGHLCGETVRVLESCRGMKAVAITLMPDRMAGVANLPVETWIAMYRAAFELHTGMTIRRYVKKYRRETGQWVVVLIGHARRTAGRERQRERATSVEYRTKDRERSRVRYADPDEKERRKIYERARRVDPERKRLLLERQRARFADPEYRERSNAAYREWAKNKRAADPEWRARVNERARAWRAARKVAN